jgi:Ca2+-binding RTX toxin-like protein
LQQAPGEANVDIYVDFTGGQDELRFDGQVFTQLGASGDFDSNDERFFAAAGASAAHDASDRLVYNTSTGDLWYDPDGTGSQAALHVARLDGSFSPPASLQATDIAVDNGSTPPPQGGQTITGTAGNDSLTGTSGNDTLDGLGGADTMNGMLGDDTYVVTAGDVLQDSGGIDTVRSGVSWTLGAGLENITLTGTGAISVTGNELGNLAIGNGASNYFNLRAGNDTVQAGAGDDRIDMSRFGTSSYGDDVIDGGAGFDLISFHVGGGALSGVVVDLAAGTATGGGQGGTGSAQLTSIERVVGTNEFSDVLSGSAVAERLEGRGGNDTLSGLGGSDTLIGDAGLDTFVFASAPGSGNVDLVTDFVGGTDELAFENGVFTGLGGAGSFTAGDARFAAGAGFSSGRDASDRIVYNTTTGSVYYDADGSGSGGAQLIATLQGNPGLAATDVTVI